MCGNFGLIMLKRAEAAADALKPRMPRIHSSNEFKNKEIVSDERDVQYTNILQEVSKTNGIRIIDDLQTLVTRSRGNSMCSEDNEVKQRGELLPPLAILQSQTAATEIRGGQAGGISCIESRTGTGIEEFNSSIYRTRCVARKRFPLAEDLVKKYQQFHVPNTCNILTFVCHTRFATASQNIESELHPHEWVPPHEENVWKLHNNKFVRIQSLVGIHISHNGDLDELEAYSQKMIVGELGLWLERVLHCPNSTNGDSPKIAGCMDLLCVQGRLGPACRLAYIRLLKSKNDVCCQEQLSKQASNSMPSLQFWIQFAERVFEPPWKMYLSDKNIISIHENSFLIPSVTYTIHTEKVNELENEILESIKAEYKKYISVMDCKDYLHLDTLSKKELKAFIHFTLSGFLYNDLYTSLTEFLYRAEGSFGIQCHSTLEPGVVVIASKGQPMSLSFDSQRGVCLYGSEAEAIAVPVDVDGRWLESRIDLDSKGEIVRLGLPSSLKRGRYKRTTEIKVNRGTVNQTPTGAMSNEDYVYFDNCDEEKMIEYHYDDAMNAGDDNDISNGIQLDCGISISSYSLVSALEASASQLNERVISILSAAIPFSPTADIVASDLANTPGILAAIDNAWSNTQSLEHIAGTALTDHLIACMQHRIIHNTDTVDLLLGGIECSLWVAEQFAADLRLIFPNLNVETVSSNKLLGLESNSPGKVFFPGADQILSRRIDSRTCVMLISQSGQTFATLHATRNISRLVEDRLWIMTGCFHSKMEGAMLESYKERRQLYQKNRILNNYSGSRPAEPSSAAAAAAFHTLTRLLLLLLQNTHKKFEHTGHILQQEWKVNNRKFVENPINREFENVVVADQSEKSPLKALQLKMFGYSSTPSSPIEKAPKIIMNLSSGCVKDIEHLLQTSLITDVSRIVGHDISGNILPLSELSTYNQLRRMGYTWSQHVSESWRVTVIASIYLFISITFGVPLCLTSGNIVYYLMQSLFMKFNVYPFSLPQSLEECNDNVNQRPKLNALSFNILNEWNSNDDYNGQEQYMTGSYGVRMLISILLQFADALLYIYIAKIITTTLRYVEDRPLTARSGKRTVVIVDTPMVHQMTENFVSKLFSQAYSSCSIEVHGASGLDHFVHRFTHRVTRGLLMAVGRPDGRLCCLAKSEAAVILACKQAAFVQNPDYKGGGSGPEILTIGHNPYAPKMGCCHHITLTSSTRKKFVDEYLYEKLYHSIVPFTSGILFNLYRSFCEMKNTIETDSNKNMNQWKNDNMTSFDIPYGVHHISPSISKQIPKNSVYAKDADSLATHAEGNSGSKNNNINNNNTNNSNIDKNTVAAVQSSDPGERLAFASKLDQMAKHVQDNQKVVQQFYECRIAQLERYLSFCVVFHTMAEKVCKPVWKHPWNIARSQSNLRVATTSSPISSGPQEKGHMSQEVKVVAKTMYERLRGFPSNF